MASVDRQFNTTLHRAAHYGHVLVMEVLLALGPDLDINAQSSSGHTALMIATMNGHIDAVQLLLNRHANVSLRQNQGASAIYFAIQNRHLDIIRLLAGKMKTSAWSSVSPLIAAVRSAVSNGYGDVVDTLFDVDDSLNLCDIIAPTVWMIAVQQDYLSLLPTLVSHGGMANIDAQNDDGLTALMQAVQNNAFKMTTALMICQADINLQDIDGDTALMMAIRQGNVALANLLLDSGADTLIKNNNGQTAESIAASQNLSTDFVDALRPAKRKKTGKDQTN